jgi:hypothetical protein
MVEQILGLSIVQQPTARRGTPIGMARRMPDGPTLTLPCFESGLAAGKLSSVYDDMSHDERRT